MRNLLAFSKSSARRRAAAFPSMSAAEVCEPRRMLAGITAQPDAFRVVAGESLDSSEASLKLEIEVEGRPTRQWTQEDLEVEYATSRVDDRRVDIRLRRKDATTQPIDFAFVAGEDAIRAGFHRDVPYLRVDGSQVGGWILAGSDVTVHDISVTAGRVQRLRLTAGNAASRVTLDYTAPNALTANDSLTDEQRADLDVRKADFAEHGQVVINADGKFTYTPEPGFVGTDSFKYFVRAAGERSQLTEVTVEVAPLLRPRIQTSEDRFEVVAGRTLRTDGAETVLTRDNTTHELRRPEIDYPEAVATEDRLYLHWKTGRFDDFYFELIPPLGETLSVGRYDNVHAGSVRGSRPLLNYDPNTTHGADVRGGWVEIEELKIGEDGVLNEVSLSYQVSFYNHFRRFVQGTGGVVQQRYVRPQSVLENDREQLGRLEVARLPDHGDLALNDDGTFEYTPDPGFGGVDSFSYRRVTGLRASRDTPVHITVFDTPKVTDTRIRAYEDLTHHDTGGRLFATDVDTPRSYLTYRLVDGPKYGRIEFNADASFSYMPAPDFFGEDFFTYVASDGLSESTPARVTIDVVNRLDRPRFVGETGLTVREDAAAGVRLTPVQAIDPDDAAGVAYRLVGGNTAGIFDFDEDSGQLVVRNTRRLEREFHRTYKLVVDAVDRQGQRTRSRYTVDVLPVDDLPRLTRKTPARVIAGQRNAIPIDLLGIVDADTPLENLTVESRSSVAEYDDKTRTLSVDVRDIDGLEFGVPLVVRTKDGLRPAGDLPPADPESQIFRMTSWRPPLPPAARPLEISLPENSPVSAFVGLIRAEDPNGDPLRYAITDGGEGDYVRVNATTGELRLPRRLPPAGTTLNLTVNVRDNTGRSVDVPLTVRIREPRPFLSPVIDVAGSDDLEPVINISRERVLFAVTGTPFFSAHSIDPETVRFGRSGWEDSLALEGSLFGVPYGRYDADGDGYADLIAEVDPSAAGIVPGPQVLTFTARTYDGQWIRSRFEIEAVFA